MDKNELEARVQEFAEIQPWNHNFILPSGVETRPGNFASPAKNANKLDRLLPIFSAIQMDGKVVFDVGCNEGFFSLAMAQKGAEVVGLDVDKNRIEKANFIREVLAEDMPVTYQCKNFLSDELSIDKADLTLCLGFLHRVPDPITAITKLASMSDSIIFEWKASYTGNSLSPTASFTNQKINETDTYGTEFWLLSVDAMRQILGRHGMSYTYLMPNKSGKREIMVASKKPIDGLTTHSETKRNISNGIGLSKEAARTFLYALQSFISRAD